MVNWTTVKDVVQGLLALAALVAIVLLIGLSGCLASANPTSAISTAIPTSTFSPHSTSTPSTPTWTAVVLPTRSSTVVPAVPEDKRIAANIDVGGRPGTMALGNGYLWVIVDHSSIVRIDPQTDQVLGKPIPLEVPASVPDEAELLAIAVGQDSVWVSIVGAGDSDERAWRCPGGQDRSLAGIRRW